MLQLFIFKQNPFGGLGSDWFFYDFKFDDSSESCSDCNGAKLIREIKKSGKARLAGVVLCDASRQVNMIKNM